MLSLFPASPLEQVCDVCLVLQVEVFAVGHHPSQAGVSRQSSACSFLQLLDPCQLCDTYTGVTGIKRTKSVEPTVLLGEQSGMCPLTVGEGATIDWPWLVVGGPASAFVPLELVLAVTTIAPPDPSLHSQAGGLPLTLRSSVFPVGAVAAAPM